MPEVEIAREEVKEECGYLVEVEKFYKIVTFPGSVGIAGNIIKTQCIHLCLIMLTGGNQTLFSCGSLAHTAWLNHFDNQQLS